MKINGKDYQPVELDYNAVCELDAMGAPIDDVANRSMSFLRAYAALCMGAKAHVAGREIQEHVIGGGTLDEISTELGKVVERSGFFQALRENAEKKAQPDKK